MVPLVATVTFNIKKVRIERLFACTELFPFFKGRIQQFLYGGIVTPSEIGNVINCVQLIILLDRIHIALA